MKIAIIADIHSDLLSLEKAMILLKKKGYDKMVCLGDIAGYSYHYHANMDGRNPDGCIELVKENCDVIIAGNHDLFWSGRLPDYMRKKKYPDNWYELDLTERMKFSGNSIWLYHDEMKDPISREHIEFLASLTETSIIEQGSYSILFSHFLYPDLTGSTKFFPDTIRHFRSHLKFMKKLKCLFGIMGHGHLQGYSITTRNNFRYNYFGRTNLNLVPQVIICPAITRGDNLNGFVILDTSVPELEAIKL